MRTIIYALWVRYANRTYGPIFYNYRMSLMAMTLGTLWWNSATYSCQYPGDVEQSGQLKSGAISQSYCAYAVTSSQQANFPHQMDLINRT